MCYGCRHYHSLTSGTAFHGTRKGLRKWFLAIYLMVTSKRGLSAKELQHQLGLGSYETAWSWLQKLWRYVVNLDRSLLSGNVEVDESYLGGPKKGKRGRGAAGKSVIACAVETDEGGKMGRVRLMVIENCSKKKLNEFVQGTLELETTVHTDGWRGYNGTERSGFAHVSDVPDEEGQMLPAAHRVFSLLKRWLLGTHHGSVSRKHLQKYLHEFEFRFNRRTSHSPTHLVQRLMEGTVRDGHHPYWTLVGRIAPDVPLRSFVGVI